MAMPRHPHEQVRMALKFRNQIRQGYGILRIGPPTHLGMGRSYFDVDRYMRGDDHELSCRVAICEFFFKPGPTRLVQKAMAVDVDRVIVFLLGIVEHDYLDRDSWLRHETITCKSIIGLGHVETVTDRT